MRTFFILLFSTFSFSIYSAEFCKAILINHKFEETEYRVRLPIESTDSKLTIEENGERKKIDANDFLLMKLFVDDSTDKFQLFLRSSIMTVNNKGKLESNFNKSYIGWMSVIKITNKLISAESFGIIEVKKSRGERYFLFSTLRGNYTYRTIYVKKSGINILVTEGLAGQRKVKPYNRYLVKVAPVVFKDCPQLEKAILADKKKKWYFDDVSSIYENCE